MTQRDHKSTIITCKLFFRRSPSNLAVCSASTHW